MDNLNRKHVFNVTHVGDAVLPSVGGSFLDALLVNGNLPVVSAILDPEAVSEGGSRGSSTCGDGCGVHQIEGRRPVEGSVYCPLLKDGVAGEIVGAMSFNVRWGDLKLKVNGDIFNLSFISIIPWVVIP